MQNFLHYQTVIDRIGPTASILEPLEKQLTGKKMLPGDKLRVMSSVVASWRKSRCLATKHRWPT